MVEAILRFGYYIFLLLNLRHRSVRVKEVARLALRLRPDCPVLAFTPIPQGLGRPPAVVPFEHELRAAPFDR
jgi:hypothetical protein